MSQFYSRRNLDFLLFEVFDVTSLLALENYKAHDRSTITMILDAADQLAKKEMQPYNTVMDREEPVYDNGKVNVHPQVRKLMKIFGSDGWINQRGSDIEKGHQLPMMVSACSQFIFGAANYSASVYPFLTSGVANLIENHGSYELKSTFLPKLYGGQWQGTMVITEPEAGSSVADILTKATLMDASTGKYSINGQKIFISAGDHDGVDNVVHLVLARIKGAPEGTKGLSLFVVPKFRLESGKLVDNDVMTSGIFHKMGYVGAPIADLKFGPHNKCHGYLLGEANHGLKYMFEMMNDARIAVGVGAASIASAAYYASLHYARERKQGRKPGKKNATKTPETIINHADVKRMLLMQRAVVEGSLSLLLQCTYYDDMAKSGNNDMREILQMTLSLLTPAAKSYPSEMGILSTSAAIQILGGAGYCKDFPVEQYFREMRIHAIHEGTTGIQAIDLLSRKIVMGGGIAFRSFTEEVSKTIKRVQFEALELKAYAERLNDVLFRLQNVTMKLSATAMRDQELFLEDATLYLDLFGTVAIGWQWLKQALVAQLAINKNGEDEFYRGKILTMQYYFEYELSKSEFLLTRLNTTDRLLLDMESKHIM